MFLLNKKMIKVLITHNHTSGGKKCQVSTSMSLEELNFVVAWLQKTLDKIALATPLLEDDCIDLLCNFYGCKKSNSGIGKILNLCTNWDTYVCGPLCEERKPFVDQCANEDAFLALKELAVEMEKCMV